MLVSGCRLTAWFCTSVSESSFQTGMSEIGAHPAAAAVEDHRVEHFRDRMHGIHVGAQTSG